MMRIPRLNGTSSPSDSPACFKKAAYSLAIVGGVAARCTGSTVADSATKFRIVRIILWALSRRADTVFPLTSGRILSSSGFTFEFLVSRSMGEVLYGHLIRSQDFWEAKHTNPCQSVQRRQPRKSHDISHLKTSENWCKTLIIGRF